MQDLRNIVILTGAGISAESGIATFRGPGGLWEGHRVEDVCTPEALAAPVIRGMMPRVTVVEDPEIAALYPRRRQARIRVMLTDGRVLEHSRRTRKGDPDDPLTPTYPGAQFVVRVAADEVFPNCPRYIHRLSTEEMSAFVPAGDGSAPVPDWKRSDWACDVLPADDPARG